MGHEVPGSISILVVTGSRADYGHEDPAVDCSLFVTGSHLSAAHGMTVSEIEADGFPIRVRFSVETNDDSPTGITNALAQVINKAGAFFGTYRPDAVVVYGDRWEMFGVGVAASIAGIPLIHIGGGDTTEGAYDENFRHSLTKMSALHFVTHAEAKQRVLQMGESEDVVYTVGSLAIDALRSVAVLSRAELERELQFRFKSRTILVTYHPTTLYGDPQGEVRIVLEALRKLPDETGIIITHGSLDAGSNSIRDAFDQFAATRSGVAVFVSLGLQRYCSVVSQVDVVVGNSSSGLYEVPSFRKPTVNIGDRQRGRCKASSVIDVPLDSSKIAKAITEAFEADVSDVVNPYGDGTAAKAIAEALKRHVRKGFARAKHFVLR
jgi:UDP-N-acetylglucosamine 2-epimerase (non-hydrolysing)/GDP/UDP-N,N'-diacetylbacillosamine 2-epimerase (hydrolysing)